MPEMSVILNLPYPPSVNKYWRRTRSGGVRVSGEGVAYREAVVAYCKARGLLKLLGPLSVRLMVYVPDRRRRDLDNILKALLDALAHGGVYEDDSQIAHLELTRAGLEPGGRVCAEVKQL